ncbi:MAG: complex I subunit 1 family protein [Pirellulaceae bacterium]
MAFLFFPGFLFTAAAGLLVSWYDRKLTARVQMRKGPPLLQPVFDIAKLMIKETCVPEGTPTWLFLSAPLVGLAGVSLASMILCQAMWNADATFAGDLIVVIYLLALPSLAIILGAFASQNPLASLGGSREMKLVLAYELPFVLAACVPILTAQSIQLGEILTAPAVVTSLSGILALIVAVIAMQARLTRVPFDIPEAECELGSGVLIEYSGPALAIYKLNQAMMLFTGPMFLLVLYGGGISVSESWLTAVWGILKLMGLVTLMVLIRNTAPRLRIDQAMKLLWGPVTLAAVISLTLAWWGI